MVGILLWNKQTKPKNRKIKSKKSKKQNYYYYDDDDYHCYYYHYYYYTELYAILHTFSFNIYIIYIYMYII